MKKTILLIGGAGFLGSAICRQLHTAYKLVVFDNLLTGRAEYVKGMADLVIGDVTEIHSLREVMLKYLPEIVVDLAAIHHIPTCEANPLEANKVNYIGTHNILKVFEDVGFCGRFLFASTGAVYSPLIIGDLHEDSPTDPVGIYALGKYASEKLIQIFSEKSGLDYCVMRIFNLVGPNETNSHLLPDIFSRILADPSKLEHGNLSPLRDYLHVDDAAQAIRMWIEMKNVKSNIYNLSSGFEYSVRDVIDLCLRQASVSPLLKEDKRLVRKIDRPQQHASICRIKDELSWEPKKSLQHGIEDLWCQLSDG